MFSSWRYDTKGNSSILVERSQEFNPVTAKTIGPQACGNCRAKKLKCTGEKTGCGRCHTLSRKCTYSETAMKGTRARRRQSTGHRRSKQPIDSSSALLAPVMTPPSEQTNLPTEAWDGFNCSGKHYGADSTLRSSSGAVSLTLDSGVGDYSSPNSVSIITPTAGPSQDGGLGCDNMAAAWEWQSIVPEEMLLTTPIATPMVHDGGKGEWNSNENIGTMHRASIDFGMPTRSRQNSLTENISQNLVTCHCLHRIILIIDDMEELADIELDSMDTALNTQKEALRRANDMLACTACVARVENMTILAYLIGKLARTYQAICGVSLSVPSVITSMCRPTIGNYTIDSPDEFKIVMRGILGIQIRSLQALIDRLNQIALRYHSETMARRLATAKGVIDSALEKQSNIQE
ncbi:hypothetical protein M426DRAFT_195464 [Hypoxylon sp. CI-4A]|nr:hypothetical protein M426DRAFT_195464 [Hypoxylon sp. CI-4A]